MRVWVTRTQPHAEATADLIRALGHDPVIAPVLEVRFLDPKIDTGGIDALAFTSRNGVRAFARLSERRDLPVFTTGEATADTAREVGFGEVSAAGGGVEDLAALIVQRASAKTVLWPAPIEPAGDLVGLLESAGVKATAVPAYETRSASVQAPIADCVLIHSAKAARIVADICGTLPVEEMDVLAISEAAAAPLMNSGFRSVAIAAHPNETALLNLLPS